ncbi:MAG TPA: hypothetical protein VF881_08150 [Polyangiaceae bacterium]
MGGAEGSLELGMAVFAGALAALAALGSPAVGGDVRVAPHPSNKAMQNA